MILFNKNRISWLKNFYLLLIIIILCLIIGTPYIIRDGISFMREEYLEGLLIALLLFLGWLINGLYRKELAKNFYNMSILDKEKVDIEDKLNEAFKYIGALNVQISAIKSLFVELDRYPESKNDMKSILKFLADKILSVAAVDWVVLKIVDIKSSKTLRETSRTRSGAVLIKYQIDNRDLIEGKKFNEYQVIASPASNMTIRVFCLMPKIKLSNEQKVILTTIVKQLEMLFIIFESRYYNKRQ